MDKGGCKDPNIRNNAKQPEISKLGNSFLIGWYLLICVESICIVNSKIMHAEILMEWMMSILFYAMGMKADLYVALIGLMRILLVLVFLDMLYIFVFCAPYPKKYLKTFQGFKSGPSSLPARNGVDSKAERRFYLYDDMRVCSLSPIQILMRASYTWNIIILQILSFSTTVRK